MNIVMGPLILKDCLLESTIKDLDDSDKCVKVILREGKGNVIQELTDIEVTHKKKTLIFEKTPHDGLIYPLSLIVEYDGQTVYGPTAPVAIQMCSNVRTPDT